MSYQWIDATDVPVPSSYKRAGKIKIEHRIPTTGEMVIAKQGSKQLFGFASSRYGERIELIDGSGFAVTIDENWVIVGTIVNPEQGSASHASNIHT